MFIVEESFAGALEAKGFEERTVRLGPVPEFEEAPGQFWKDFIRETAPVFRTPTIEQLQSFIAPTFQALIDGARYVDDRLAAIFDELAPDVIIEDNVVAFPAIPASGRPWVRIMSCNPAELKDPDVPPVFSGYPTGDRAGWSDYWEAYRHAHDDIHADFSEYCRERGAPALRELDFIHPSPHLNLYLYPTEVDYVRARGLDSTWHNLGSSVRTTDAAWRVPDELARGDGALIYLSLGSLGSGDVGLMQTLIATLADCPHRVIVSMGPQHDQLTLAGNMAGAEFLPQTSVLPEVDLVITHGGNNTVTESLYFGKPMVVLPLFWDQYDNAQRIHETGLGRRLDTYGHAPAELRHTVDRLLEDGDLAACLTSLSAALRANPGTGRAADLIERLTV
ncbi:MAG TPA: nucleotide disphospho-sugar-binding domain-containing protein [Solirubrobacteraceae bacterium]|nr:nucleotide disphospho-sugar-binding domain-containing protein [Solirubrobacteraceae bacterium]